MGHSSDDSTKGNWTSSEMDPTMLHYPGGMDYVGMTRFPWDMRYNCTMGSQSSIIFHDEDLVSKNKWRETFDGD